MATPTVIFSLFLILSINASAQEAADIAIADAVNRLRYGGDVRGVPQYKMPPFVVVVAAGNEINAYADPTTNTIRVTRPLLNIMSPGELMFVIAHEIGHLQDSGCVARGTAQRLRGLALRRMCEAAADQIGVQYLLAAGYSSFEGAGVMGKLLMANPSEGSVMGIIVNRFLSDHPVDVDRIRQLAVYAKLACQNRPEMCQQ